MDRHIESEPSLTLSLTRKCLPSRTVIPGTKRRRTKGGKERNERFMSHSSISFSFLNEHTLLQNRSSCSNDKCLFQTNIDMFPQPESIKWNPDTSNPSTTSPTTTTTTQHRDLLQAHEARFKSLNYPKPEFVAMHTYHYAVDQDLSTCWQSFHPLEKGGYFGLRFVLPLLELGERAKSIEVWSTFETTLVHLGKFMVVKASVDGTNWVRPWHLFNFFLFFCFCFFFYAFWFCCFAMVRLYFCCYLSFC